MRDYEEWHLGYDDPSSSLSWRLRTVQRFIDQALDRFAGPVRILSACSGDARDVLGVLGRRGDAARVTATLIERHPEIAGRARRAAAATMATIEVRNVDAGTTDAYRGAVPAHVVLLVGIFGNIDDADLETTIACAPQLCAPGAVLLWTRGRATEDRNGVVRSRFAAAGFAELDYLALDEGSRPAVGALRYDGPPVPLARGQHLFTFRR